MDSVALRRGGRIGSAVRILSFPRSLSRPPMLLRSSCTSCAAVPLTAAGSLLLHSAYDAPHKPSLFSSSPLPRCLCPHPGGSSDPRVLGVRRFPWGPTSGHTALSGHWPDAASKALSSSCPGAPFAVPGLGSALPSVLILTLAGAMFKDVENRRALAEEAKKKNPRRPPDDSDQDDAEEAADSEPQWPRRKRADSKARPCRAKRCSYF